MKRIYFVLTYSGTFLGKIIKFKTKKEYSHVSISLDENLQKMYSFSRLHPYNCFIGGFVHEKQNEGVYKRFKKTSAKIYSFEISDYQYEKLENQIELFEKNKLNYKFNILGLLFIFFDKEIHRENYFYCAEFIKYILNNASVNINLPSMPKPENFENLERAVHIYSGLLNDYKYNNTQNLREKIC